MFDYSKLLGLMAEKGYTKKSLAEAIGMSVNALINKFKGRSCFSSEDIASICNVLGILVDRIGYYFFTLKVENQTSTKQKGEEPMEKVVKEIMDFLQSKVAELNEAGYEVMSVGGESFHGRVSDNETVNVFFSDEHADWFQFRREENGEIAKESIRRRESA